MNQETLKKPWIRQYLRKLWGIAFVQFASWHRFLSIIIAVFAAFVAFLTLPGLYKLLGVLVLVLIPPGTVLFRFFFIAPAFLWREQNEKISELEELQHPRMTFIDHRDNYQFWQNVHRARVTVKNESAALLTNVQVKLESIDPLPSHWCVTQLPLRTMHTSVQRFSLQPLQHQSVDVVSLPGRRAIGPFPWIDHLVNGYPRELPWGSYKVKLVASADNSTPKEQWFKIAMNIGNRDPLQMKAIPPP
jgi:hypothetical protein